MISLKQILTILGFFCASASYAQQTKWTLGFSAHGSHSYLQSDYQPWFEEQGQTGMTRWGYYFQENPSFFSFNSYGPQVTVSRHVWKGFNVDLSLAAIRSNYNFGFYYPPDPAYPDNYHDAAERSYKKWSAWRYQLGLGLSYQLELSPSFWIDMSGGVGLTYNGDYRYEQYSVHPNGGHFELSLNLNGESQSAFYESNGDTSLYYEGSHDSDEGYVRHTWLVYGQLGISQKMNENTTFQFGLEITQSITPLYQLGSSIATNDQRNGYDGNPSTYYFNWGFYIGVSTHFGKPIRRKRTNRNGVL